MTCYVEPKDFDPELVRSLLEVSRVRNHWSNFGPGSERLSQEIAGVLGLGPGWSVVTCCSATAGLQTLWALQSLEIGRPAVWAVSSFGFASTALGLLGNSAVVDCDGEGMLDLDLVPEGVDAILPTNVFGSLPDMTRFEDYAVRKGVRLIVDAAMALDAAPIRSRAVVSFHHTKPWGFGEGGCVVVETGAAPVIKDILNFKTPFGMNGKMSDVAAAFISLRLGGLPNYRPIYQSQYDRVSRLGKREGFSVMGWRPGTPACVPLLAPGPVSIPDSGVVTLRKYYRPLTDTPVASEIHSRIVNFPCQPGVSELTDDDVSRVLGSLLSTTEHPKWFQEIR